MIQRIIQWSTENVALVLTTCALLAAASTWGMLNTPVDAIPDLSDVQVIVTTEYRGQGPQIVEQQVTYPLASALLAMPHARTVRGYSMFGVSFVHVIFDDHVDLYFARSRVLEHLNSVASQLPPEATPSIGPDATGLGWVYAYSVVDSTGNLDLSQLRSVQDFFLKYELQGLEGVAEIATVGGFQKQYQVVVDPQRLAAHGVTPTDVATAIRRSNYDRGARLLEVGGYEIIVRARGYLKGVDDIRAVPLKTSRGSPLSVGDVATVQLGPELRRGIAEKDGEGEVVGGIVVMRYGESSRAVIRRVKERLDAIRPGLPDGVHVIAEYDRSALVDRAIGTLKTKLWQELAVVALVVMAFLAHMRSAFVAVITIPVGILLALLAMYLLGVNANIMSLGGIAISIGVMVDASMVMVENAHRHIARAGDSPSPGERVKAVAAAAGEVGPSLFFSLLIVTVSFLPVFSLGEVEGRLFRPLAYTKTFAMAASAGLAITLVPALMTVCIRGRIRSEHPYLPARLFARAYRPFIVRTLRRPVVVPAFGAVFLAASILPLQQLLFDRTYVPFAQIGSEFMPPLDEGDILYMPTTLPGVSLQTAKDLLQQTNRILAAFPEVEGVFGKAGRAETATDPAPLSMLETIIRLKPKSAWRPGMTRAQLVEEMDRATNIPGLTNAWTMPIKARLDMLSTGIRTPVGVRVSGPDHERLQSIGQSVERALQDIPGTQSAYAERVMGASYLDIDIDRAEAARYGLTTGDVQDVISTAVGGVNVTTTVEGLERYPVNVRYPRALRDNLPALRGVLIPTHTGSHVPLGQIAALRLVDGPAVVKSENARPALWVLVDLKPDADLGSYLQQARAVVESRVAVPTGYSLAWGGQFESMQRAGRRLRILVPAAVLLVFMLLLMHFKSAAEALLLLLPLPFAVSGAVWLMAALNYKMSIAVGVGIIAVAGLAAETGVVMFIYLRNAVRERRAEGGLSRAGFTSAIVAGASNRVRPVLMTVSTTILALLPIMLGSGTGAEVMKRIATPIVGGLLTASITTLFILPALYVAAFGPRKGSRR